MKKLLFLILALLTTASANAYMPTVGNIVLGVNLDPTEKQFYFPCTIVGPNIVFCDEQVSIADLNCKKTLSYQSVQSGVDIVCQTNTGNNIVLAQARGELLIDNTTDAFGGVHVKLNPKVSMKAIGQNNYQLVIAL